MKAAPFSRGSPVPGGMAERLKAAVLKTAKGSQPFVGSNPTSSVASFFESSQVWRDGREAEGTGLLNLHIRKGIEGSNPSLSVRAFSRNPSQI